MKASVMPPKCNQFIAPGNNSPLRQEFLNEHSFSSLDDARQKVEEKRKNYHEIRTHSVMGNVLLEDLALRDLLLEADKMPPLGTIKNNMPRNLI